MNSVHVTPSTVAVRRLFLVEDELAHAQMMEMACRQLSPDWQVLHCATGREALDSMQPRGLSVALAVVDLGLPDMDGLEVVSALRRRFPKVPILIISSISNEQTLMKAIRAGANGYLLKDGNVHALAQGMMQVLQGQSPISPALARHLFKLAGPKITPEASPVRLTGKERETLEHFGRGHSYAQTASLMGVGVATVQTHVRNLYRKLGAHSQTQAVIKAKESGLL
jgi:DNA-binding NarL/FixJ family response regulator